MPDLNRVLPNINQHCIQSLTSPVQARTGEKNAWNIVVHLRKYVFALYTQRKWHGSYLKKGEKVGSKKQKEGAIKPTGCNSFWQRCFLLWGTRYAQPLTADLFISNKIFAIGVHFCPNSTSTRHGINSEFCPNSTFPGNDLSLITSCKTPKWPQTKWYTRKDAIFWHTL